jgi:histidine ammonia-lyase
MTVVLSKRDDVNLKTLKRVAFDGEKVRFSSSALKTMARANASFQRCVEEQQDTFIYGVTSGGGPDAKKRYTLAEARNRSGNRMPWQGLSFGGEFFPEYVSRGAIFTTLTMFVEGNTATHPDRAERVARMLDGKVPLLPEHGLVAAGELMPNFILFHGTRRGDVKKEGFMAGSGNGSQTSSAMAGITAILARRRLELAQKVIALSIEGFNAPLEAYDPALKELWGDVHEAQALDDLNRLLRNVPRKGRRFYQAPVSYRILPRVLGQAHRAVAGMEEVGTMSLRTIASNPTYVLPSKRYPNGRVFSTGGYHNPFAAPAMDEVAASWVDIACLLQRHIVKFHKGEVSLLPDRLLPEGTDYTTGYSTTYIEYVPNDFVESMRRLASPATTLASAEVAASEQDDVAIPTPIAFRTEREVAALFDMVCAVLAVVASQALHVTGRTVRPPLRDFVEGVRGLFPPVETSRPLGEECRRVADAFSAAVEKGNDFLPWN